MVDEQPVSTPPSNWGRISSIVTFLVTFGALAGIFLYAFGQAASDAYLMELGVSASTFDRQREWKIFFGYSLLIKHALLGFLKLFWPLISMLFLSAFVVSASDLLLKKSGEKISFSQWIRVKLKPFIDENSTTKQRLVFCLALSASIPILGILFLLALLSALSIPGNFGAKAGKQEAAEKILKLKSMDGSETTGRISILKDGKVLLEGYPLASGENFAAFYDAKTKTVHTFHMDGIELRRQLQPLTLSAVQEATSPAALLPPAPTFTHSDKNHPDWKVISAPASGTNLQTNCHVVCDGSEGVHLPFTHPEATNKHSDKGEKPVP